MKRRIDALLLFLIALDLAVAAIAFFIPDFWFSFFHGAANVDPQGLLQRMGANWTAFAVVQIIALVRWRKEPSWLAVVAGARLSDMFTDWTCLYFCRDITQLGRLGFLAASPSNVLIGLYLIRCYRRIQAKAGGPVARD